MSRESLTVSQQNVLRVLEKAQKSGSKIPSYREICKLTGYKSLSTVANIIDGLEEKGYVKRTPLESRSLRVVDPHMTFGDLIRGMGNISLAKIMDENKVCFKKIFPEQAKEHIIPCQRGATCYECWRIMLDVNAKGIG